MVEDEWLSRGNEFQMTGTAERKERDPKLKLEKEQESTGHKNEGNEPVSDNECEKKDIEENLYRGQLFSVNNCHWNRPELQLSYCIRIT